MTTTQPTLESIAKELRFLRKFIEYQEIGIPEAARILNMNERVLRNQTAAGLWPNIPGARPYKFVKSDLIERRLESTSTDSTK
jgi:hypothetical protein